jgi:hypothetical protein
LENLKGRDYTKEIGVDGRIRINSREIRGEVVNWIHVAQDREEWRVLVNKVMNFRVP